MPSRELRDPALRERFRTRDAAMRSVLDTAEKVLHHDASILIAGESGTGKNHLAEAIAACSDRRERPFVHIDCASIPPDLFETELFGHERGAFTDAHARRLGKLETAGSGVVYLDELAALTPQLQAKLLRVLEDRRFTRVGGSETVRFDARVISSTSSDVRQLLSSGLLRPDLYYRLNVVALVLPPLRERRADIPLLAALFLRRSGRKGLRRFEPEAARLLTEHSWPGNVRELRNVVERAALIEDGPAITAGSLGLGEAELVAAAARASWTLETLESYYIRQVLRVTQSNNTRAAEVLGINRKTLREKRRKYGIE
ncbi:MAG: sigma-54 dependent transcriptional regulator [Thermoanaerobaculia bacterium]